MKSAIVFVVGCGLGMLVGAALFVISHNELEREVRTFSYQCVEARLRYSNGFCPDRPEPRVWTWL